MDLGSIINICSYVKWKNEPAIWRKLRARQARYMKPTKDIISFDPNIDFTETWAI